MCPVLDLKDPEVHEILSWFRQCYDVEADVMSGVAYWRRVALPAAGGIGDQDARLLHAIEYVATVAQEVMNENAARRRLEATKKAKGNGTH